VAFVWNISAERDRADASQKAARVAQAAAEAALAELTLNHAQLLLATDPSAAVDELLRYAGRDRARAEQIRAEAVGRGVAVLRATPQSENVLWVTGGEDGVVTSLNLDGTIVRTSRDGRSVVAARGASRSGRFAYAERTHVLAYACDPADLCLFDVLHATPIAVGDVWRDARVAGVAFSADATSLALVGRDGTVSLFDMTRPAQPIRRLVKSIAEARGVAFLADDAVIVKIGKTRSTLAVLHANGAMAAIPSRGVSLWTVDERQHRLALATEAGDAQLFEGPGLEMTAHLELCHGPVEDLRFLSGRPEIAYACERGEVGTWSPRRATGEPRAQLDGRCTLIQTSASGEYILALGRDGVITLVDLVTGLATSYRGHPYRVQYVAPPTGAFPFVISADVRGGIRVWPLPVRVARVAATVGPQPNEVVFSGPADNVVLTAWLPSLTSYSPSTGPRAIDGHEASNINLVQSGSGATLATYGETDTIEIWSSANLTAPRLIQTGHGSVSRLHFIGDREDFLTAGHDGRLIRWSSAGEPTLLARQDRPIDNCIYVPATGAVIYTTADGALWRVTTDPRGLKLRDAGVGAGSLVADPDQRTVYVGYANGEIVALDTTSWQQSVVLRAAEAVHAIVVARDGRTVIATTNDGVLHLGTRRDPTSRQPVFTWTEFRGHAREVALAADGLVIVPFTDGTLWIYSQVRRRWLCIPLGVADLGGTAISANGNSAVVLGGSGRVVWIDLQLARLQLGVS
jgi:WD40 repeat protein